jgi:hypothetical protein
VHASLFTHLLATFLTLVILLGYNCIKFSFSLSTGI